MAPHIVLSIQDLNDNDQVKLTQVLQIRLCEDALQYTNRVSVEIQHLPTHLKRPKALIEMLVKGYEPAPLCKFHKSLNARLIRSIFSAVAVEIGLRCNSFMTSSSDVMVGHFKAIVALRRTHSMWLDPETFRRTFGEEPTREWPYQQDQCEACMLSRIGGNLDILSTLRSVLLSRTRTKSATRERPGMPRLLRFVEKWIVSHGQLGRERLLDSDRVGADLKVARKNNWRMRRWDRERRAARQALSGSTLHDDTMDKDFDYSDPENEVIDHYAALVSTSNLPLPSQKIDQDTQAKSENEQFPENVSGEFSFQGAYQEMEQKNGSESRRDSTQTYVSPRNNWIKQSNLPPPSQPQRQASAPPTGQLYANPDLSSSWMSVSSVYPGGNPTPMSSSAYLQPRQIWENMREQTMHRPGTSSPYGEERPNSRDSTISLPYVAPLNPGRCDVPANANRGANSNAESYQNLLSPHHSFAAAKTTRLPVQGLDESPPEQPLDSGREYVEATEQMRHAHNDLLAALNQYYPNHSRNMSVASLSTTGRISPKTMVPRR